jgi:acetyltransferase-like isoleucine patch superfamily enzyme
VIVGPCDIEIGADAVVMEHGALVARNGGRIYIGDRTVLARGVRVTATSSVVLGDSVLTSDFVTIADSVVVHDGAYLGYGAVIGPGVTIGAGAVIGEGAVVEHDVPPHTVVAGDPAAAIRRYDGITGAWIDEPHG